MSDPEIDPDGIDPADMDDDPDDQDDNAGVFDEDKRRLDPGGDPRSVDEQIVVPSLDSDFVEELSGGGRETGDRRRRPRS